jgi:hypothetical protein
VPVSSHPIGEDTHQDISEQQTDLLKIKRACSEFPVSEVLMHVSRDIASHPLRTRYWMITTREWFVLPVLAEQILGSMVYWLVRD